ncbi:hypothetical protein [Glutamicibacter ardleyensis]|uniref:hypothetical protein n=1 Tax=Glutamicibacter ardleyensis TaxID=225894 RepID=UPI003FD543C6
MDKQSSFEITVEVGHDVTGKADSRYIRVDVYKVTKEAEDLTDECHTGVYGVVALEEPLHEHENWFTEDDLILLKPVSLEAYFYALGMLHSAINLDCVEAK